MIKFYLHKLKCWKCHEKADYVYNGNSLCKRDLDPIIEGEKGMRKAGYERKDEQWIRVRND